MTLLRQKRKDFTYELELLEANLSQCSAVEYYIVNLGKSAGFLGSIYVGNTQLRLQATPICPMI